MEGFQHILVDGWNVIHAEPKLKSLLLNGSQDAARAALRERLAPLHDFNGTRVTIVYDGVGDDISIERRDDILTFSEVFTPSSMTADELIEQLCATSKSANRLLVVSRDNLLRLTASSFGAMSVEPENILEWSEASRKNISKAAASNNVKSERAWKKESPFDKLDILAADLNSALHGSPLLSKKLKKRIKRCDKKQSEEKKNDAPKGKRQKLGVTPQTGNPRKSVLGGASPSARSLDELKKSFLSSSSKTSFAPAKRKSAKK